jgi:very-short-patch-repair endonuclease
MISMKNNYYSKSLKQFARKLRKDSTLSEINLWKYLLKSRGLKGYQFLRQRPIGRYIVDFYCKDLKLIIEHDGETHLKKEKKDMLRKTKLEGLGNTLIRFRDSEVLYEFDKVKSILENGLMNMNQNFRSKKFQ